MSVIGSFTASSLSLLLNTVGALLNSIAAISAGLSRNIQLLSGESDGSLPRAASRVAISLSSLLSSAWASSPPPRECGLLAHFTHRVWRSPARSRRWRCCASRAATERRAYLPLLYQWKLIDAAETLLLRTNVSIDVVNISTGWISAQR